jgi:mRNA-degrading endonuclease RelE of RelBE toxin-antitoxin system
MDEINFPICVGTKLEEIEIAVEILKKIESLDANTRLIIKNKVMELIKNI